MSIADNITAIRERLPAGVTLVAVSKNQPPEALREAYRAGQRIFGENRVQELLRKRPELPPDTEWHFIGHLQTNKVRDIVPFISLIQSVDSLKLLREIDKEASRLGRVVDTLLQFHIGCEETKFGLTLPEARAILSAGGFKEMNHVRVAGVMGMASFTEDHDLVRSEFRLLHSYYNELKTCYFNNTGTFRILSMGMSGDYSVAIEEGSNLVRVGTGIFGVRSRDSIGK